MTVSKNFQSEIILCQFCFLTTAKEEKVQIQKERKQKCNSILRGYRPDLLTYISDHCSLSLSPFTLTSFPQILTRLNDFHCYEFRVIKDEKETSDLTFWDGVSLFFHQQRNGDNDDSRDFTRRRLKKGARESAFFLSLAPCTCQGK